MKRLWIILLLIVAIGGFACYKIWNKPHPKAEDQKAVAISSMDLFAAFKNDEDSANKAYLNKVIAVSGQIVDREKNQDGKMVAVLIGDSSDDLLAGGVMCTFRDNNVVLPEHGVLQVKGFCTGFANDVHLSDCVLNLQSENK